MVLVLGKGRNFFPPSRKVAKIVCGESLCVFRGLVKKCTLFTLILAKILRNMKTIVCALSNRLPVSPYAFGPPILLAHRLHKAHPNYREVPSRLAASNKRCPGAASEQAENTLYEITK